MLLQKLLQQLSQEIVAIYTGVVVIIEQDVGVNVYITVMIRFGLYLLEIVEIFSETLFLKY
jgi:hypothetical protein